MMGSNAEKSYGKSGKVTFVENCRLFSPLLLLLFVVVVVVVIPMMMIQEGRRRKVRCCCSPEHTFS